MSAITFSVMDAIALRFEVGRSGLILSAIALLFKVNYIGKHLWLAW
ncbi:hypothetical protein [Merismopedia glauca]|nr:hypothetical protein [Merismopedia glauca]